MSLEQDSFIERNRQIGGYLVVVTETERRPGERWYMAAHPDLPGCISDGMSMPDALAHLREARDAYFDALTDQDDWVPNPVPVAPIALIQRLGPPAFFTPDRRHVAANIHLRQANMSSAAGVVAMPTAVLV